MSNSPIVDLEARAAEQRLRLHTSVNELKGRVLQTLDVKSNVRDNIGLVSGVAAIVGLTLGYNFAGIFTRR
jgi:hypothetical protein